jgi:DNA processing protein
MQATHEDLALLALSLRPNFSWAKVRVRLEEAGSAVAVLDEEFDGQLSSGQRDAAIDSTYEWLKAQNEIGVQVSTILSPIYPTNLRSVHDAPPVIYWQGSLQETDIKAVAIVGTRQPTEDGAKFAQQLGRLLAEAGTPVVSGLARGVDSIAMRASLNSGGRTIGIIGTGHGKYYPAENRSLQDHIGQAHLLISQFAPGATASKRSFPMRNVVMSGFSSATVIAEAGETSGTRIQARAAIRHGRPLILNSRLVDNVEWARELVEQKYDVQVAHTALDAAGQVADLHLRREFTGQNWGSGELLSA